METIWLILIIFIAFIALIFISRYFLRTIPFNNIILDENSSWMDVINTRISSRTYSSTKLPILSNKTDFIINLSKNIIGPFKSNLSFYYLNNVKPPGTSKWVYGCKDWLVGTVKINNNNNNNNNSKEIDSDTFYQKQVINYVFDGRNKKPSRLELVDFGYVFETLILNATKLNLATCWIGGIHSSDFEALIGGRNDEEYVCSVCAIGNPVAPWFCDCLRLGAFIGGRRKAWSDLFYSESFKQPLIVEEIEEPYISALEAIRQGPSDCNTQKWRIVKNKKINDDDIFHFCCIKSSFYCYISSGIAMCHFDHALKDYDIFGDWIIDESCSSEIDIPDDIAYIASWKRRN